MYFTNGDADGDGAVELNDGLAILNFLFQNKRGRTLRCVDAADADDSGAVELNDAIRILNFKFLGGPSPAGYFGKSCAPDPGPGLGCQGYDSCPAPRPVDTSLQAAGGDTDPVWEPRTKPVVQKVKDPVVKPVVPKVNLPTLKPRQPTTKVMAR